LHAVNPLNVEVPPGRRSAIEQFYGGLLGLPRLAGDGDDSETLLFGRERMAVRFVPCERPRITPRRRRITLTVESLDTIRDRLTEARRRYWTISGLSLSERSLLVVDPFDQLVELRQSQRL